MGGCASKPAVADADAAAQAPATNVESTVPALKPEAAAAAPDALSPVGWAPQHLAPCGAQFDDEASRLAQLRSLTLGREREARFDNITK
jgi:hypothetical protein